jgi:hypothetical protein
VLWVEPQGGTDAKNSSSTIITDDESDPRGFTKIRRFVIMRAFEGHCTCLPLLTYQGRGTLKHGVHASYHAAVFTGKNALLAPGELEGGLTRAPLRIVPSNSRENLDPMTRINYAKPYTVEYNVKTAFIGKVHKDSMLQLVMDYDEVHSHHRVPPPSVLENNPPPNMISGFSSGSTPSFATSNCEVFDPDLNLTSLSGPEDSLQNFNTTASRTPPLASQLLPENKANYFVPTVKPTRSFGTQTSADDPIVNGPGSGSSDEHREIVKWYEESLHGANQRIQELEWRLLESRNSFIGRATSLRDLERKDKIWSLKEANKFPPEDLNREEVFDEILKTEQPSVLNPAAADYTAGRRFDSISHSRNPAHFWNTRDSISSRLNELPPVPKRLP